MVRLDMQISNLASRVHHVVAAGSVLGGGAHVALVARDSFEGYEYLVGRLERVKDGRKHVDVLAGYTVYTDRATATIAFALALSV